MIRRAITVIVLAAVLTPLAANGQFLMMPDSTNNRLVLFSPADGSVINNNLFGLAAGTPLHAMQVRSEIWVSEQVGDRISRWDFNGNSLGAISGGLDNVRGMEQVGNTVYLTNSGTANGAPGPALVMFDVSTTPLGFFSTAGLSPSPFGALDYQGGLLVSSSSANDDIHKFTLSGTSLGTFYNGTGINFVEQLNYARNGNILAAGFSSPAGIYELDATTGAIVGSFAASGPRGVYQLTNGDILWSNGSGAHVYDPDTGTSTQVYAGGGRYFDYLLIPEPASLALLGVLGLIAVRRR